MARVIQVGGRSTARAGVYQNSVQRSSGTTPGFLPSGIVCILGEGEASIQPKVLKKYKKGSNARAKSELSGDLLEALRIAFQPSNDDPQRVRGASEVWMMRVNPATQSTLDLENGSGSDNINLTSRGYGIAENGIQAKIEAGTSGALGKKLTINKPGFTAEVKDDLGYNAAIVLRYTGDGSTAVMQLTRTTMTTTLAGDQTDGSANLSIAFTTYDTLQKLVDYINAQTGYEAELISNDGGSFKCEDLDFVAASTDIKTITASGISFASATTDTFSGTFTSLADGDIFKIGSEYVYVTSASSKTVIRGYLDTTPAVHSSANAAVHYPLSRVNKDIIDWCNASSQHVTAARDTAYETGTPSSPSSSTYFTSGSEGSASASDWTAAFNEMRRHYVNHMVVLDNTASVHAQFKTHMTSRWDELGMECLGYTAAAQDETFSQLKVRAKALNEANISLHFQDVEGWFNASSTSSAQAPWAMACAEAGMRAGMIFGEGVEYKILPFTKLDDGITSDLIDLDPDLTQAGLSYGDYEDGFYRFVRCVSTWTNTDDLEKIDFAVRNSLAWTLYKVRRRVKEQALARSQAEQGASSLKSIIEAALDECLADGAIVQGSRFNANGDREDIPAYEVFEVDIDGNTVEFGYRCVPAGSNTFFSGDTFVEDFQDVA
jgi:hypothetical protein